MEQFNLINNYIISNLKGEFEVFSPFSLSYALSLVYIGSKGETTKLFKSVFGDLNRRQLGEEIKKLNKDLAPLCLISNGIFINKENSSEITEWAETKMKSLNTTIEEIEMDKSGEKIINKWISESTKDIFKDVVKDLSSLDILLIINCIYFKGDWTNKFNDKLKKMTFNGKPAKLMTMDKSIKIGYYEDKNVQVVEIPYKLNKSKDNSNIVFGIILSKNGMMSEDKDDDNMYYNLEHDINKYHSLLKTKKVELIIPPFEFKKRFNLKEFTENLGLGSLFSSVNINKIIERNDLYVSEIIQEAYIKVDQKGTTAAAVTVIATKCRCEEEDPFEFIADHSFTFYIRDNKLNVVLFTGFVDHLGSSGGEDASDSESEEKSKRKSKKHQKKKAESDTSDSD